MQRLRELATGTTSVGAIYTRDLLRFQIPLPRLSEQLAIAEALEDADALIGELEALIGKKRDIKKGAMQELLTGQRRLPGFQEVWVTVKFGAIVAIRNEKVQTRDNPVAKFCVELEQVLSGTGSLVRLEDASDRVSIKYRFEFGGCSLWSFAPISSQVLASGP